MRVCSTPGCPTLYDGDSTRCPQHDRQADRQRGNRGYQSRGHRNRFRPAVLARDPICVVCHVRQSTIADHYPLSRKELLANGMDADNPAHGRGLCKTCHDRETAHHQPGGWHADQ